MSAAVVGIPTDVIDTSLFTRMTPVRWWDYPVLVATVVLTAVWVGIRSTARRRNGLLSTSVLSSLAVGCPICNKIVVALVGVSGALGIWAPLQPVLAAASVLVIGIFCCFGGWVFMIVRGVVGRVRLG